MIEVKNISKVYKKNSSSKKGIGLIWKDNKEDFYAVKDISFDVSDGEILGFVGPNGAGKSTTIKMLTGILTPTHGEIKVNGLVPYKERKRYVRDIGVVFGQRTQLWWDIPLNETFKLLKEVYMIEDKAYMDSLEYLDSVLELSRIMSQPVRSLSLGQRMKADIAASLIHNPNILFLDEPTIGLDVVVKDKIINSIKEINEARNVTIILTTHDLADIEKLCKRIVVIDKGEKVYDDGLSKLKNTYSRKKHLEVRFEDFDSSPKLDYLNRFPNGILDIQYDENTMRLTTDGDYVDIQDVIRYTLDSSKVRDINIADDDISDIIKQLYMKGNVHEKN